MPNALNELRLKLHRILDDPQFADIEMNALQEMLIKVGVDRLEGKHYAEVSAEVDRANAAATEVSEAIELVPPKPKKEKLGKKREQKRGRK